MLQVSKLIQQVLLRLSLQSQSLLRELGQVSGEPVPGSMAHIQPAFWGFGKGNRYGWSGSVLAGEGWQAGRQLGVEKAETPSVI